jgi:peptidoglycan/LPS O-acetylase OafA/YrhL
VNKTVSLYLNAARFTAAMMVFLSHLSKPRITHGFLGFVPDFSSEAVDAFFVISGFVIAYVTFQTEHDATSYSIRRAARIYSVALPAIALTLALDAIGMTFGNPAPYLAGGDFDVHHRFV